MVRVPTHREPTHPGAMLREEFLGPMGLSQSDLADGIHVPYQRVNELVNGKRGVSPATALRLGKVLRYERRVLDESPAEMGSVPRPGSRSGGAKGHQADRSCGMIS